MSKIHKLEHFSQVPELADEVIAGAFLHDDSSSMNGSCVGILAAF